MLAVDPDVGRPLEDHVEAGPGHPLAQDELALRVEDLLQRARDALELRRLQVPEEREVGEDVCDLLPRGHRRSS